MDRAISESGWEFGHILECIVLGDTAGALASVRLLRSCLATAVPGRRGSKLCLRLRKRLDTCMLTGRHRITCLQPLFQESDVVDVHVFGSTTKRAATKMTRKSFEKNMIPLWNRTNLTFAEVDIEDNITVPLPSSVSTQTRFHRLWLSIPCGNTRKRLNRLVWFAGQCCGVLSCFRSVTVAIPRMGVLISL